MQVQDILLSSSALTIRLLQRALQVMTTQKEHNSRGQEFRLNIRGAVSSLDNKAQFWDILTLIIPIPSMPVIKKSSALQRAE